MSSAKARLLEEMAMFGEPRKDLEPAEALVEEMQRTAGHVAWLGLRIEAMEHENEMTQEVGGGEGGMPKTEASVWLKLYQDERGHLMRIAKACVDVGIDERRVRIAEAQGRMIAKVISGVLGDLGIAIDQRVREVVRHQLTAVSTIDAVVVDENEDRKAIAA